jgi:DNA polymerase-3 subunit delta
MPEIKSWKLAGHIKKDTLSSVYFFYGREELLKEEAVQSIIGRLVQPQLRDFNLDILYGDEVDGAQIIDRLCELPMMAERRVVVVRNSHELSLRDRRRLLEYAVSPDKKELLENPELPSGGREKLLESLSYPFPHACLILTAPEMDVRKMFSEVSKDKKSKKYPWFQEYVDRAVCHVNFYPLWDSKIPEWIRQRAQRHGKSIDAEATQLLIDCIGNDLVALDNEIQKLAIFVGDQSAIKKQDVQDVVGELRAHTAFELCDAVGFQDVPKALALLSLLLEAGIAPTHILWDLRRHLVRLAKVGEMGRENRSKAQIMASLRVPNRHIGKYIEQAANFHEMDLEEMFARLYETERNLKRSRQEVRTAMTLLIYGLCKPAGARGDERS